MAEGNAAEVVGDSRQLALVGAEQWFFRQGVPHFILGYPVSGRVPAPLQRIRTVIVLTRLAFSLALWTVRRALGEAREMGHLAMRALPLLALFGMVIFFTGDFWHIAAALSGGWLGVVAGWFLVLTLAFVVSRLPEELATLSVTCPPDQIRSACSGTPLEELAEQADQLTSDPALGLAQRRNMFAYLLLCQQIQVALLSWLVFFFYVGFGSIAIRPAVLADWFGRVPPDVRLLGVTIPGVSSELLHVAFLLAGLSAFYFSITAITDGAHRREFFDRTLAELNRAIHVRCAYLTLRSEAQASPAPAWPDE